MFGLYTFTDWSGTPRMMSASAIHKKVIESSKKSNYNWIASATELVNVCQKKNFPLEYAIDIKSAILNCYAILINSEDDETRSEETDIYAVYYAYNSLYGVECETASKARRNFLMGFLRNTIFNSLSFLGYDTESYLKVYREWSQIKLEELISLKKINFDKIKSLLLEDFRVLVKIREKEGIIKQVELVDYVDEKKDKKLVLNMHKMK